MLKWFSTSIVLGTRRISDDCDEDRPVIFGVVPSRSKETELSRAIGHFGRLPHASEVSEDFESVQFRLKLFQVRVRIRGYSKSLINSIPVFTPVRPRRDLRHQGGDGPAFRAFERREGEEMVTAET